MKTKEKECHVCKKVTKLFRSNPPTCANCVKRKPINKISKKHKETIDEYVVEKREFLSLPENQFCKLKLSRCTQQATVIHHLRGKTSKKLYLDKRYWMPSCWNCNFDVESLPEAYKLGLKLSRNNQVDK